MIRMGTAGSFGDRTPRESALDPGQKKVKSPDAAVHVNEFADDVNTGDCAQLHGGQVELLEWHPTGRYFGLCKAFVPSYVQVVGGHELDEGSSVGFLQGRDVGVLVDAGSVAEEGCEGRWEDAGED